MFRPTNLLLIVMAFAIVLITFVWPGWGTDSLTPIISILCVGLAVMVLIINCRKPPSGQNLVVYVPIPKNTPDKMLPLLLTPNDIKIVSYLRKHGKAKEDKKGTTISYSGLTTYIPKRKLFIIIPYGLITPTAVKVLSCTYYRTKRK